MQSVPEQWGGMAVPKGERFEGEVGNPLMEDVVGNVLKRVDIESYLYMDT